MKHSLLFTSLLAAAPFAAGQSEDLLPGQAALGDFGTLSFSAHLRAVQGLSTADDPGELGTHAHDPFQEDLTLQSIEPGLSFRSQYFEAFANGVFFTDEDNKVDAEWEEAFGKIINIPGGFEVRGGRFLNRFGLQNNVHQHGWNYVDAHLLTGTFLGEEGLRTDGVELSWLIEGATTRVGFSLAAGNAVEDVHEEEPLLPGEEHNETIENSYFNDDIATARVFFDYRPTDFINHRIGLNHAAGGNAFGRDSSVTSIDYTFSWRENGLEPGGRAFDAGFEFSTRNVEWVHEDDSSFTGDADQFGTTVFVGYNFDEFWRVDLRHGFLEGVVDGTLVLPGGDVESAFNTEDRHRTSLAVTRGLNLADGLDAFARLQYNYDNFEESDDEHSIWLQVGFDFGAAEVR